MRNKIVFISDFNFRGSGYLNISIPLCEGLANHGYDVKAVGLGYVGTEHTLPFTIIPCNTFQEAQMMLMNLHQQWKPDLCIVALDIPRQDMYLRICRELGMKMIAITPLENPPLTISWAYILQQVDKVFFISQLGTDEAIKAGVEAEHLVVGMDTNAWRMRTAEEYRAGRAMMNISPDTLVVITVADNQERKNLSKAYEIVSKVKKSGIKVKYILVTRENLEVGYKLRDLGMYYNIASDVMIFERGISFKELYSLYAISDAFLLTSKGEGLCCLPSQKVWTSQGIKNIEDVTEHDTVVSHSGSLSRVEEIYTRKINEIVNRISVGFGYDALELTDNHRVLGAKASTRRMVNGRLLGKSDLEVEWIPSQELKKGDYVFFPDIPTQDVDTIYPEKYLQSKYDFIIKDNFIYPVGKNQTDTRYIGHGKVLPTKISINHEFMESLGWYLAEGCDTRQGLSFSLNANEVEFQERIKTLMNNLYGENVTDNFRERHRYDGRVHHTLLGRFYSSLCGDGAHNKSIPSFALFLPDDKQWPMLEALFSGDGSLSLKSRTLRYSTVSKTLAQQIQFILLKLGVVSSFKSKKGRVEYTVTVSGDELMKIPFIYETMNSPKHQQQFARCAGGWLFPIRKNEKFNFSGWVYNLEVEKDNSFLLGGGMVHNCEPVLEAMSIGVPVVAPACGSMPELLADGRGFIMDTAYPLPGEDMIDPWGNEVRTFPSSESGSVLLNNIHAFGMIGGHKPFEVSRRARAYMESRTWDKPIGQLVKAIKELINE